MECRIYIESKALQIFYWEGNACNKLVTPQGCVQCMLMRNTEFKHDFLFSPQGTFKSELDCAMSIGLELMSVKSITINGHIYRTFVKINVTITF